MQSFQIAALPAYPVYYMRRTGPYGKESCLLMEQLKVWAEKKGLLTQESIILGVIWDGRETPPAACRYDACIVRDEAQHLRVEKLVGKWLCPAGNALCICFMIA